MIRFLTAGESHGRCLVGILEGMPAGLAISEDEIAADLRRRQQGYGRGQRMKIEHDHARILSGVRYGVTLGSPIALQIENQDWAAWQDRMRVESVPDEARADALTAPRPGHADLAGALKYHQRDLRNVIERSSARETAMRVALGAICRKFFREFGLTAASHVVSIGGVHAQVDASAMLPDEINRRADANAVRCLDAVAAERMVAAIDEATARGDTVGGLFEVVIAGVPTGLGSNMHPDRRLDAVLAQAVMSIPAVKSVTIGFSDVADLIGSKAHDEIVGGLEGRVRRATNRAGGIEGGMSNGEAIVILAAMKPLATLARPLQTVDMRTGERADSLSERSDICAVPSAAVVAEAVCLIALMNPFLEKFGGDSMEEIRRHVKSSPASPWESSS